VSRSIFWTIVRRDLRFAGILILTGLVLGILGLGFAGRGKVGSFVSIILLITGGLAPGIFICSIFLWGEIKEKSRLFSLSLPISPAHYALAKGLAALIAYVMPWAVVAATAIVGYTALSVPSGGAPLMATLWLFLLDVFCIFLCITLVSDSEALFIAGIVFVNTSIAPFFFVVQNIPSIGSHVNDATALWSPAAFTAMGIEIAIAIFIIAFTGYRILRMRDFV
jgi:ABC-2 type transport system permease protein